MADMFADRQLKFYINKIIENHGKIIPSDETTWFSLTRMMFKKYPATKIWEQMELALCEASDEDWFEHKYPKEIFIEKFVDPTKKIKRNKDIKKADVPHGISTKIASKISIIGIADKYGLKPLGRNKRVCPFHADSNPSLSLSDEKGLFNCFGCSAQGNIVDFIYLLRKYSVGAIKNGN